MSRSIKFRFFMGNYNNPKYEYWDNLIKIGGGELIGDYLLATNPLIIIEQYTGLKDKNGIEVYEGDILDIWDSFVHNTYVVVFDISELDFKATNEKVCYGNSFSYLVCCDEIEVIGNIHENADLINVIKGE